MKINKGAIIGGLPIKVARDLLRHLGDGSWSAAKIASNLKISTRATKMLITAMIKERLLEQCEPTKWSGKIIYYQQGGAAGRLRNVRFIKRIERDKAEKILADFLRRVVEVNGNVELCCFVQEARLFGSMLDKKAATVGDIDIAFELGWKKPPREYKEWIDWLQARGHASGRKLDMIEALFYGEYEVRRLLKSRSRYLSLHDMDDLTKIGAKSKRLLAVSPGEIEEDMDYSERRRANRHRLRD